MGISEEDPRGTRTGKRLVFLKHSQPVEGKGRWREAG